MGNLHRLGILVDEVDDVEYRPTLMRGSGDAELDVDILPSALGFLDIRILDDCVIPPRWNGIIGILLGKIFLMIRLS
jgi:hypothetical protein